MPRAYYVPMGILCQLTYKNLYEEETIILISQMKQLRDYLRNLFRMYMLDKWWIWDLDTANRTLEFVHLTTMVYFLWKYCYPTPLLLYDKDKEIFPVATLKQFVESSFCPFSYGGPYGGRFGRED